MVCYQSYLEFFSGGFSANNLVGELPVTTMEGNMLTTGRLDRLDRAVDIGRMLPLNKDATGTVAKNE